MDKITGQFALALKDFDRKDINKLGERASIIAGLSSIMKDQKDKADTAMLEAQINLNPNSWTHSASSPSEMRIIQEYARAKKAALSSVRYVYSVQELMRSLKSQIHKKGDPVRPEMDLENRHSARESQMANTARQKDKAPEPRPPMAKPKGKKVTGLPPADIVEVPESWDDEPPATSSNQLPVAVVSKVSVVSGGATHAGKLLVTMASAGNVDLAQASSSTDDLPAGGPALSARVDAFIRDAAAFARETENDEALAEAVQLDEIDAALKALPQPKATARRKLPQLVYRTDVDEQVSMYEETTARSMDMAYDVYTEFNEGILTGAQAIHELENSMLPYDDTLQKMFDAMHADLTPVPMQRVRDAMYRRGGIIVAYNCLFKSLPTPICLNEWEKVFAQSDDEHLRVVPAYETVKALLDGIDVALPFRSDPPKLAQCASHPQMAATRKAASTFAYIHAAKGARLAQEREAICGHRIRSCVVDVGAGSFGCEKLQTIKCDARNKELFVHACVPRVDAADYERTMDMMNSKTFLAWNYVPATGVVYQNRLNWCNHTAAECNCLRFYDSVQAVAINVAYYFREIDYRNLFKYTDRVECVLHLGKPGDTIPSETPEYRWIDATTVGTFFKRVKAAFMEEITGIRRVILQPMRTGCTTYEHQDMQQLVANGGFHSSPETCIVEENNRFDDKMVSRVAKETLTDSALGVLGALANGTTSVPLFMALVLGLTLGIRYARHRKDKNLLRGRLDAAPPKGTDITVAMRVRTSYEMADTREDVVHTVTVMRRRPAELIPQVTTNFNVDPAQIRRSCASLLMGADTEKTRCQVGATLLRDNVPVKVASNTVQHCWSLAKNFWRKEDPAQPPLWRGMCSRLVWRYLPSVWGCLGLFTLTIGARLSPSQRIAAATVQSTATSTSALSILGTLAIILGCSHLAMLLWVLHGAH